MPESGTHSFHRGALSLDFVGTLGRRGAPNPVERIADRAALRQWLVEARLAAPTRMTTSEYDDAIELREAIERIGRSVINCVRAAVGDVRALNAAARWSRLGARRMTAGGLASTWDTAKRLRFSLGCVAVDAIRVLTEERGRITACALDDCRALLLSHSRSEPRKWCTMDTCGNRAKVAAFRERRTRGNLGRPGSADTT